MVNMKNISRKVLIVAGLALTATACSSEVKESLGLKRNVPDEFRVIARPPLSVPPNFSLRPPLDEEPVTKKTQMRDEARKVLISEDAQGTVGAVPTPQVTTNDPISPAERKFLSNAGADEANPGIKNILEEENTVQPEEPEKKPGFWDKVMKRDEKEEKPDPVVDAVKESERIKANKKESKPVTDGETPTVQPGSQNILQRIFSSKGEK